MQTDSAFDRLRKISEPGALLEPEILARILEVLPDMVLVIDEHGVIRFINHQGELMFGYAREAILGQKVEILLPDGVRTQHEGHRKQFFDNPTPRPMGLGKELRGKHRNGGEIALEINLSPIVTANGVYGVAVVRKRRGDAPTTS
jgi:PAS domain S-box-containing protein